MINNKLIINNAMTDEEKSKAFDKWRKVEQHNEKVCENVYRNAFVTSSVISIVAGLISYFGFDATIIQAGAMTVGTFIFMMCCSNNS